MCFATHAPADWRSTKFISASRMAEVRDYCGTWRIVKCVAIAWDVESTGIEGTEFTLDESGDVTWNIPENTEHMPFFNCETYEGYTDMRDTDFLIFFGAIVGHVIEFRVDHPKDDAIQLTYEGWCVLQCERVYSINSKHYVPFSFLCALEEGYFSDLSVFSNNGKEFKVHKTVLKLGNSSINWNASPCLLSNLPEDVLFTILHYLYSECLPCDLGEETARSCLAFTSSLSGFEAFRELCELFLKNSALKQQIITLVTDMHTCANRIIDYFSGKIESQSSPSSTNGPLSSDSDDDDENFANNPAKLKYVIIQALREIAIAGVKMLILCDLFTKRKNELSREERHEIIKYCKSRLPIFMNQLYKLLDVIKISFGNLSAAERMDIASYFVPEIESALDLVFDFVTETKSALEQIINVSSTNSDKNCPSFVEKFKKGSVGEALGRSLKNALHMRELMKLRSFHERATVSFMNLMHKKESFSDMNYINKNRQVTKNLEQFIDEIPMFMLRTEELKSALDEKLTWKEWKYLFKLGTSKVAWALSRLVCHRATLHTMISHICELVNREQFTRSLVQIGLLDPPASSSSSASSSTINQTQARSNDLVISSNSSQSPTLSPVTYSQFCLVESLCHPPVSTESKLAKNAVSLLKSGIDTDMSFEIVTTAEPCENSSDQASVQSKAHAVELGKEKPCSIIKAHCVVIASRCDWFRKALLSGMKESINKKIVIHDTTPELFLMFLEYLYGGQVDTGQLSTEQLADLMQLSDRYEVDSLKQISEEALKNLIDDDSALFLLSIADQFNARALRTAALEFIALNKDIIKSDVFYELPEDLQSEVEEMITWVELRNSQRSEELSGPQYLAPDSPSSMSSSLLDIEELTSAMNMSGKEGEQASDCSSLEDLPLTHDSAQLEACVAQLRDIVGETVAREELIRVSLAADYDVNRALNFFFS